jgi:hypothetical protein
LSLEISVIIKYENVHVKSGILKNAAFWVVISVSEIAQHFLGTLGSKSKPSKKIAEVDHKVVKAICFSEVHGVKTRKQTILAIVNTGNVMPNSEIRFAVL